MTAMTPQFRVGIRLEYIETTIPAGVTIDQYRRSRARRPNRWQRLKQLAGGAGVAMP